MILRRYYLGDRAGVSNVPHSLMRRRGHGRVRPQRGSRQASERKPDEDEERRDVRNAENRGNAGLSRHQMLASRASEYPTYIYAAAAPRFLFFIGHILFATASQCIPYI